MNNYYPSLEEFKQLASANNIVPVYRQLFADALTPVSAFQKLSDSKHAFLLESAAGGEKISRYSILGSDPFLEFTSMGTNVEILRKNGNNEKIQTT
ncbi:MAG: anthranilate synthase component I, partial [Chitinophagaceae bacterium]|nr:anthranilate synthase component I [Chitinophagaceae bacterium]